jgi:beta-lactamase regulating signal transducer with metallopeptidase domain
MYSFYHILFRHEKTLKFNRFFLLASAIISLIIPLVTIPLDIQSIIPPENIITENGLDNSYSLIKVRPDLIDGLNDNSSGFFTIGQIIIFIYIVGFLLFAFRFGKNLHSIIKKIKSSETTQYSDYKIVLTNNQVNIHCFLNWIFIFKQDYPGKIDDDLLRHELEHLRQLHSLDIIFYEIFQIIFWFNPIIILYKRAIRINHEFLADEAVLRGSISVREYSEKLINYIECGTSIQLISGFNNFQTKKRIIMMTKKQTKALAGMKLSLILPLFAVILLILSSFRVELTSPIPRTSKSSNLTSLGNSTVNNQNQTTQDTTVYNQVDKMPEFPAGPSELNGFIKKNLKYPPECKEKGIEGRVFILGIIEKDGSVTIDKVLKGLDPLIDKEAIRVIKSLPNFSPGILKGNPARVNMVFPIEFKL